MTKNEITETIIGCAMEVHKTMGNGFQEVVYQRCLALELQNAGILFEREIEQDLSYKGNEVGTRRADFIIEGKVVVELKTVVPADDYVVKEAPESNKIDMWGQSRFRYKNRTVGEREIQEVLLKSKDKKIISLVGSAKDAKRAQYIGFAGIPLGIGAGGLLLASISSASYSGGIDKTYLGGAAVCALVAIACPIVSINLKSKRNKCNKEAVRLYNEKY